MPEQMIGKPAPMPKMGSLKQAAGKRETEDKPTMSSSEVIKNYVQKQGGNANSVLQNIAKQAQAQVIKIVQLGNSVFILKPTSQQQAEFYILSDEPNKLASRLKSFFTTAKQLGFNRLSTLSSNPDAARVAKESGASVKQSMSQMMQKGRMVPAMRFDVDL